MTIAKVSPPPIWSKLEKGHHPPRRFCEYRVTILEAMDGWGASGLYYAAATFNL